MINNALELSDSNLNYSPGLSLSLVYFPYLLIQYLIYFTGLFNLGSTEIMSVYLFPLHLDSHLVASMDKRALFMFKLPCLGP